MPLSQNSPFQRLDLAIAHIPTCGLRRLPYRSYGCLTELSPLVPRLLFTPRPRLGAPTRRDIAQQLRRVLGREVDEVDRAEARPGWCLRRAWRA